MEQTHEKNKINSLDLFLPAGDEDRFKLGEEMKNGIIDMQNHLFIALERLNDDEICHDRESIATEVARAEAIRNVADSIIAGGNLMIQHEKLKLEYNRTSLDDSPLFIEKKNNGE